MVGILLAAGSSSRMGRPKQLLSLEGRPLLQHALDRLADAEVGPLILVLGHAAPEVQAALRLPPGTRVVVNPEYASGQASSLQVGLQAAGEAKAAVILLGDQPGISSEAVREAVALLRATGGPIVRAVYGEPEGREVPGHPVVLHRRVWSELAGLQGDEGARAVMERHPQWVVPLRLQVPPPLEVDTWEDYLRVARGETEARARNLASDPDPSY